MADLQKEWDSRERWSKRDVIRHKETGHPYLVLHIYQHRGTEVIDLESKRTPTPSLVILPRDYDIFVEDSEFYPENDSHFLLPSFL